jgi:hypothetical protein
VAPRAVWQAVGTIVDRKSRGMNTLVRIPIDHTLAEGDDGPPARHSPVRAAMAAPPGQAELQVEIDRSGVPVAVGLRLERGLRATDLQRFPWATFLVIADTAQREIRPSSTSTDGLQAVLSAQAEHRPLPKLNKKRPGRSGHPESFYMAVADRYRELRAAGITDPTKTLALQEGVNRATAAGWISQARAREYLGKAQPGKAGEM